MKALVVAAHGSESLETVAILNVLRRGGIDATLASIEAELEIAATRDIVLRAGARFDDIAGESFDLIVLPGGEKGAQRLAQHAALIEKLRAQRIAHHWYGAICAAPALVLSPHGLLDGKQATCHAAFRNHLLHYVDRAVVVDGHCVTSQGPATAIAFGLKLVELLGGAATARQIGEQMGVAV